MPGMPVAPLVAPEPVVSVVMLNYRTPDWLRIAIPSLQKQTMADRMEIIVADNGSGDESVAVARELGARVVEVGWNAGFAIGNNAGAAQARGQHLFFVNTDMRFDERCVERLHERLEAEPRLFAADVMAYDWEGRTVTHGATRLAPGGMRSWFPGTAVNFVAQWREPEYVPWGGAGNLMVRADRFRALGGFDPTFFLDCEDLDLCWRAWLRGWPTLFVPDAVLWHKGGGTTDSDVFRAEGRMAGWRHLSLERNFQRFALKCLPAGTLPRVFLGKLAQSAGWLARGRPQEAANIVRAMGTTLRHLPAILRERRAVGREAVIGRRALYRRLRAPPIEPAKW